MLQDVVAHPTAGPKRRYWIALGWASGQLAWPLAEHEADQRRRACGDQPSVPAR